MSALDDIGVRVVDGVPGNGRAILNEITALLERLAATGEGASIDLSRGMPLAPADYDLLERTLGSGEVSAEVDSLGPTRVRETAIPGVWWVVHRNPQEKVIAEFIEITRCPELLTTPAEELPQAVDLLRARLAEGPAPDAEGTR